jgi:hypothetical protein
VGEWRGLGTAGGEGSVGGWPVRGARRGTCGNDHRCPPPAPSPPHVSPTLTPADITTLPCPPPIHVVQVPGLESSLQDVLIAEYVGSSSSLPDQPRHGLEGQVHAVWTHRLTPTDTAALKAGGERWEGGGAVGSGDDLVGSKAPR